MSKLERSCKSIAKEVRAIADDFSKKTRGLTYTGASAASVSERAKVVCEHLADAVSAEKRSADHSRSMHLIEARQAASVLESWISAVETHAQKAEITGDKEGAKIHGAAKNLAKRAAKVRTEIDRL